MQERFETFTVLINRISRDIRRIKNQEMAAYHLRSAHVSCLYYIYSLDGVTSAELCEHCEEDKATISRALDCRVFARVDLFLPPDGEIAFNEVNTIPGFTAHSRYPSMMQGIGISFGELVTRLIELGVAG